MGDRDDELIALRARVEELELRVEDLNVFTSLVAHDIDAPARRIAAFADLLERDHGAHLDETGREYLAFVGSGAHRLRELIVTLLDFSQVGASAVASERVEVDDVVRAVLDDFTDLLRDDSISVEVGPVPPVLASSPLVGLVLRSLIRSAIRRSDSGPLGIVVHGESLGNDLVAVCVDDDVPGVATTYDEGIIDLSGRPQGRDHGHGVHGLDGAIASRIVAAMGGSVQFSSSTTGSSSRIHLPAALP